ncbi:MAG: elongation factor P [Thermoleophilia bacterium]|nr:elongation factor P [Thermoleophilia bacterium]
MVSTNDFRNGMAIEVDGQVFTIVEFQHVKPGKGGAFVRTKLKNISTGAVLDRTFRAGEKFRRVRVEGKKMLFLYATPEEVVLMDNETYEQLSLTPALVGDSLRFVKENMDVEVLMVDGRPTELVPPIFVELEVTETQPGIKGDSVGGGGSKPATLETGAVVNVPLFLKNGERVKIDTRTGEYVERV